MQNKNTRIQKGVQKKKKRKGKKKRIQLQQRFGEKKNLMRFFFPVFQSFESLVGFDFLLSCQFQFLRRPARSSHMKVPIRER